MAAPQFIPLIHGHLAFSLPIHWVTMEALVPPLKAFVRVSREYISKEFEVQAN